MPKEHEICKRCNGNNYLKTENYSVLVEIGSPKTINCPDCTVNIDETIALTDTLNINSNTKNL